jgi:uncharacterized C2H2 Zn-finger protein
MKIYNPKELFRCPKCGTITHEPKVEYIPGEGDILVITCPKCGYDEERLPLDHIKDEGSPGTSG